MSAAEPTPAVWSRIVHGTPIADALLEAYGYAQARETDPTAVRILDGLLTRDDIVMLAKFSESWKPRAAALAKEHGYDQTFQAYLNLLRGALGPQPAQAFTIADCEAASVMLKAEAAASDRLKAIKTESLSAIMGRDYPPLKKVVDRLFFEGLTILSSPAKTGKTFFVLQATGDIAQQKPFLGHYETERTGVLYLYLEGGARSIKARARHLGLPALPNVHFALEWTRGAAAVADMGAFLTEHPEIGCVIIDTFEIVREPPSRGVRGYSEEYPEIRAWNDLALRHRVAIIAVSHTKKGIDEGGDFANESYGTGGLTGGCSGIIQVRRTRGADKATLRATFREAPEHEATLAYCDGRWTWTDEDPHEAERTPERNEIVTLLRTEGRAMKVAEIASALGKKQPAISMALRRMKDQGDVTTAGYGLWTITTPCDTGDSVIVAPPQEPELSLLSLLSQGVQEPSDPWQALEPRQTVRSIDAGELEPFGTADRPIF